VIGHWLKLNAPITNFQPEEEPMTTPTLPPQPSFTTIIFDFGGVLLRTADPTPRRRWEERLGLQPGKLATYVFDGPVGALAQVGKATWEDVWIAVAKKFNLSPTEAAHMQQDFFSGDVLDKDLVNYIRRLKRTYTIGLLSNTWLPNGHTMLLQYGIADAFHFTVTSAELGVKKPDPRIFQVALERAQATPAETVFVDDMEENVLAARSLGVQAVYFVDPSAALARLAHLTGISP